MSKESKNRNEQGMKAGLIGICCNVMLAVAKIIPGLITGSLSIIADSVNNLSDAISSAVTFIGFKIAGKPADREHPYGHGRAEYIAGLTLAALIMAVAAGVLKDSLLSIINGDSPDITFASVLILLITIPVKLGMGFFYNKTARKINSQTLKAAAVDSFSDVAVTSTVILSALLKLICDVNIDGFTGAIVAIFVFYQGFDSARETVSSILGRRVCPEVVTTLEKLALKRPEVLGVHDVRVHEYGHDYTSASMHVELPNSMTLDAAHEIVDDIEHEAIKQGIVRELTIHTDPVDINDEKMLVTKIKLKDALEERSPGISIHDMRFKKTSDGSVTCELDALIPYDCKCTDGEIRALITNTIRDEVSDVKKVTINIDKS